jgi:predicted HicB family RNase H-like nuclease
MAQRAQPSLHVRLPRALHEQLRAAAEHQDMSRNALVVRLLAGGVGFKLKQTKVKP